MDEGHETLIWPTAAPATSRRRSRLARRKLLPVAAPRRSFASSAHHLQILTLLKQAQLPRLPPAARPEPPPAAALPGSGTDPRAVAASAGRDRCASRWLDHWRREQPGCSSGATAFAIQRAWQALGLSGSAPGSAGASCPPVTATAAAVDRRPLPARPPAAAAAMAKGGAQAAAQQGKQRVWKKEEVTALAAQEVRRSLECGWAEEAGANARVLLLLLPALPCADTSSSSTASTGQGKYVYTFKGGVYDVNVDEIMHPGGRQVRAGLPAGQSHLLLPAAAAVAWSAQEAPSPRLLAGSAARGASPRPPLLLPLRARFKACRRSPGGRDVRLLSPFKPPSLCMHPACPSAAAGGVQGAGHQRRVPGQGWIHGPRALPGGWVPWVGAGGRCS